MPKKPLSFSLATMWQLTWPQLIVMIFFFGLGLCDVWTAGRLGKDVQAAFGLVTQGAMFLQVIAMATASGATAAISQSIGAEKLTRAKRYIAMVLAGAFLLGMGIAFFAFVSEQLFFAALQVPQNILPITNAYWDIMLLTLPFTYIFSTSTALFRATRQVIPPIFITIFMFSANIIGNLGFGLGYFGFPSFGYAGIAWTTFGCTIMGALCNVALLIHKGYFDYAHFPPIRWIQKAMPYLCKVAVPAGASQIVWQTGYIVLFAVVASLPTQNIQSIAGLTAGMRMEALFFLPGMAFSMTASVLVGNSLGAKNIPQAYKLAKTMLAAGVSCLSLLAIALWSFIPQMAAFLAPDPEIRHITEQYLYFNVVSTPFTVASMILGGVMTGAGATRYNLMIYGGSFWLVRLPIAWIFGHFIWLNASGVFLGMVLSQVVQSLIMLLVLYKADWTRFAMHAQKKTK